MCAGDASEVTSLQLLDERRQTRTRDPHAELLNCDTRAELNCQEAILAFIFKFLKILLMGGY